MRQLAVGDLDSDANERNLLLRDVLIQEDRVLKATAPMASGTQFPTCASIPCRRRKGIGPSLCAHQTPAHFMALSHHDTYFAALPNMMRRNSALRPAHMLAPILCVLAAITVVSESSYVVELEIKGQPDRKVAYDASGKQLQKVQD